MLIVSAVMVWLVIIAAISFLMIDNDGLKEQVRVHGQNDVEYGKVRAQLREDIDKNQRLLTGIRNKLVDFEKRLETLEESHK